MYLCDGRLLVCWLWQVVDVRVMQGDEDALLCRLPTGTRL
jgi:hypothetical protein